MTRSRGHIVVGWSVGMTGTRVLCCRVSPICFDALAQRGGTCSYLSFRSRPPIRQRPNFFADPIDCEWLAVQESTGWRVALPRPRLRRRTTRPRGGQLGGGGRELPSARPGFGQRKRRHKPRSNQRARRAGRRRSAVGRPRGHRCRQKRSGVWSRASSALASTSISLLGVCVPR